MGIGGIVFSVKPRVQKVFFPFFSTLIEIYCGIWLASKRAWSSKMSHIRTGTGRQSLQFSFQLGPFQMCYMNTSSGHGFNRGQRGMYLQVPLIFKSYCTKCSRTNQHGDHTSLLAQDRSRRLQADWKHCGLSAGESRIFHFGIYRHSKMQQDDHRET